MATSQLIEILAKSDRCFQLIVNLKYVLMSFKWLELPSADATVTDTVKRISGQWQHGKIFWVSRVSEEILTSSTSAVSEDDLHLLNMLGLFKIRWVYVNTPHSQSIWFSKIKVQFWKRELFKAYWWFPFLCHSE